MKLRAWVSFGSHAHSPTTSDGPELAPAAASLHRGALGATPERDERAVRHCASLPYPSHRLDLHTLPAPLPAHDLVLAALRCPISNELMTEAVCLADGRSYQESVVALAPGSRGASSSSDARDRAVPNEPLRQICRRVATGEMPQLSWEAFKGAGDALEHPALDAHGQSVEGTGMQREALMQQMQARQRGPLRPQARPNLALERVMDVLLAQDLPLHAAVLRGDLQELPERALRNGCFQRDAHGQTALMLAAKYGDEEAVAYLLKHGAKATQLNSLHQTPLLVAVERGHAKVAVLLAETEEALDHADAYRMFPVLQAVVGRKPMPELIGILCNHGADADQRLGVTALQAATWIGSLDAMSALRLVGADPNVPRSHDAPPGVPRDPRTKAPLVPQDQSPRLMAARAQGEDCFNQLGILQPPRARPPLFKRVLSRN